jgi:starvation-inducible DNA-binding protein
VYAGVTTDHRKVMKEVGDIDPVTEDLLVGQTAQLEQFHWFVRAHLETSSGHLATDGAATEQGAAAQAASA